MVAPLVAASLISGGAALGGSVLDFFSAKSAQKGQERANREQMEFNAQQAHLDREFQKNMFESRYQATRKDLEKAGYNPLLATGMNPGTPAGAVASANPQSTTKQSADILSTTAKKAATAVLDTLMMKKLNAEATSAEAVAKIDKQNAEISTSDMGKKLAQFEYFMRKTGLGRGLMSAAGIFSATKAASAVSNFAKATRGSISFGKGAYRRS